MTDQNKEIGSRLRQIRNHLNETQIVFAERFGLSKHDIANYELGRCDIPTKLLAELDRMGVNLSWVLNGQGEKMYPSCFQTDPNARTVSPQQLAKGYQHD